MEPIELVRGTELLRRGEPCEQVVFPGTAVVALVTALEDGRAVQTAIVGSEGMVGMHTIINAPAALQNAIVDIGGTGHRIPVAVLRTQMAGCDRLRELLARYLRALLVQMGQAAACNRVHALRQRVCRWLLAVHDRARTRELAVTQELLAMRLGVRRAGVCEVMRELRAAGATEHRPGLIVIRDAAVLERGACECYGIERAQIETVFE